LQELANFMPGNRQFRERVQRTLHARVLELSPVNADLLQQAGALHLAILDCQNT
jgi:hypothetical protein